MPTKTEKRSNGGRTQLMREPAKAEKRTNGNRAAMVREMSTIEKPEKTAKKAVSGRAAQLVRDLNEDLAGEFGAIIQYVTYAAKVTGPYRPELRDFFLKEVPDEQGHAQFLANKIVALGGEPTTTPRPTPPAASNREMLAAVREAERQARQDYTKRARQAEAFGDKGLQVMLENIVTDETGHFEETERMLQEWPD